MHATDCTALTVAGLTLDLAGRRILSDVSFTVRAGEFLGLIGPNGGGKTTTIGKLAHKLTREGARVLVVPGDTFRAAAGEQLAVWAGRAGAAFFESEAGARPHAVMYSACDAALTNCIAAAIASSRLVATKLFTSSLLCTRCISRNGVREKIARPIPKGSSRGSALGYEKNAS